MRGGDLFKLFQNLRHQRLFHLSQRNGRRVFFGRVFLQLFLFFRAFGFVFFVVFELFVVPVFAVGFLFVVPLGILVFTVFRGSLFFKFLFGFLFFCVFRFFDGFFGLYGGQRGGQGDGCGRQVQAVFGKGAVVRAVSRVKINNVAQKHFSRQQGIMPSGQRFNGQSAFTQAADHQVAPGLNPFGNGDFTFAGQKFDSSHFAQVHPNRVICPAGFHFVQFETGVFFGSGRFFLFGFFVFDDVDAEIGNHRHHVFDLFGRFLFRGQSFVQLVNGNISAFFAAVHKFLNRGA